MIREPGILSGRRRRALRRAVAAAVTDSVFRVLPPGGWAVRPADCQWQLPAALVSPPSRPGRVCPGNPGESERAADGGVLSSFTTDHDG